MMLTPPTLSHLLPSLTYPLWLELLMSSTQVPQGEEEITKGLL
jgi:hypothetical protein